MDAAKQNEIKELLQIVSLKQAIHDREMSEMRKRLISYAKYFDNYAEMYLFIKANTFSLADFCKDMWEAAPIFWNSQKDT